MSTSRAPLALLALPLLALSACTQPESGDDEAGSETGEPLTCLDTDTPGEDITIYSDAEMEELALSGCVPERIIVSGGAVTSLAGLSDLREVGILEIRYNPVLESLAGIEDLERVDHLIIVGNNLVTQLPEFPKLELGIVTIKANDVLTSLGSFPAAAQLSRLEIAANEALVDLGGFPALSTVTGDVLLNNNLAVTNFAGLEGLTSIGGDLHIEDNAGLTSLAELGVESVAKDLRVVSNPALSECLVDEWAAGVDVSGAVILNSNMMMSCD